MEVEENAPRTWVNYLPTYTSIAYLVLSLCVASYSIYWMAICSAKIWLAAIGGGIFAVNFFLLLFSLAASVTKILNMFRILESIRGVLKSVEIVTTVLGLVFCCVAISLSTYAKADRYYQELVDYCQRNPNSTTVASFASTYSTYHSQAEFIYKRSTDAGEGMEALFGCWISCFIVELVLRVAGISKDDNSPLLPRRNLHEATEEHPPNESDHGNPGDDPGYEYQYDYSENE